MKILLVLSLVLWGFEALSSTHHFTDVYHDDGGWHVAHWAAEENKLQTLVETRTYRYEAQAQKYQKQILRTHPSQKNFQFVASEPDVLPLWTVANSWDAKWENKFSEWIEKEFDAEFFVRSNLATDCADVAYSLRWIFARNNNLPAAGTLGGSGVVVTHLSARAEWNNLPGDAVWFKDQRFMAALRWLLNSVYTKTLYVDSYPVKLNRDSVTAGLINLLGGHTEIFNHIATGPGQIPMVVFSSTVPLAVRTLSERVFLDDTVTEKLSGGLVKFRWPVNSPQGWKITPKESMRDYSLEQYKENLCKDEPKFALCLFKLLDIHFDGEMVARKTLEDLENVLKQRARIVLDGVEYCKTNDCAPGSVGYEDWSTPSRDKRLKKSFLATQSLLSELNLNDLFTDWMNETEIDVPFRLDLNKFILLFTEGLASFDPRANIYQRWAYNDEAIELTLKDLYRDANGVRERLISDAASCRQNPEVCKKDRKMFEMLSSVEVDLDIQKYFSVWISYAHTYERGVSESIKKVFLSMWARSPAPWDSVDVRRGNTTQKGHFLNATKIDPGGPRFLILDDKRLYDIAARKEVEWNYEQTALYYDASVKNFLVFENERLTILDESLAERDVVKLLAEDGSPTVQFFGNGQVFIAEYYPEKNICNGAMCGWTLDLRTLKKGERLLYGEIYSSPGGILLSGNQVYSVAMNGGKLEIADMPKILNLSQAFHIRGHEYLYKTWVVDEASTLYLASPSGTTVFHQLSGDGRLNAINSNFLTFIPYNDDEAAIIDLQKKKMLPGDFSLAPSPGEDQALVFLSKTKSLYFIDGERMTKLPIKMKEDYSTVVSANKSWLSFEDGKIFNYEGALLDSSDLFLRGSCQETSYNEFCIGSSDSILQETYMMPYSTTYRTYARIGKNEKLKVGETFAYALIMNDSETSGSFSTSDGGGLDEEVNSGNAIKLSESQKLWFP